MLNRYDHISKLSSFQIPNRIRIEIGKILLTMGLIGTTLAFSLWPIFLIKEQSILKQFPVLGKINDLQCKIAHIDEEMDSLITFRQAIHFRPEKFIQHCAYLEETYRNYENQYKDLISQSSVKESMRRKKRFELYAKIACLSFFGFLLLVRIAADRLYSPSSRALSCEDYISWLTNDNEGNNSDVMHKLCLARSI